MKNLSFDKGAILDELEAIELSGLYKGKELDKARHMFLVNEVNSLIEFSRMVISKQVFPKDESTIASPMLLSFRSTLRQT